MSGREKRIGGPREPLCEDNLIWVQTSYNMCRGKGFVEETYAGSLRVQTKDYLYICYNYMFTSRKGCGKNYLLPFVYYSSSHS